MEWLDIVILAIVQGIAEFLPISSSGHLVLIGHLLGNASESAALEIILHAGTLGSILVVYWRRILQLLTSDRRVIPLLVVGTLPAVAVGLPIKLLAESWLTSPLLTGCMLLVTAAVLVTLGRLNRGERPYTELNGKQAFAIGCFQACAILPGLSRSGSTILGGRLVGLRGNDAVTFSFLLAIPALCGATVLAIKDLRDQGTSSQDVAVLALGAGISFTVGIFALRWLMRWSQKDRLHWFAWWCGPLGLVIIGLHLAGLLESPHAALGEGSLEATRPPAVEEIGPGGGVMG